MALGLVLTHYSEAGPLGRSIAADTLWAGSFIPLYGEVLKLIEADKKDMNVKELLFTKNNGLSFLLMIGSSIMYWKPEDGWMARVGIPLVEAGVMYVILRLLFFK